MSRHRHRNSSCFVLPVLILCLCGRSVHAQQRLGSLEPHAATRVATRIEPQSGETWFFGRIQDIAVDKLERVYVLDASDRKIRVFDRKGTFLRALGGVGRGPGEFYKPRSMEVVSDTLWVIDNANARLTAISTATGKVARSMRATVYDQFTQGVSTSGIFVVTPDGLVDATATKPVTLRFVHERAGGDRRTLIGTVRISQPPLVYRTYAGDAKKPLGEATLRQPLDNGWQYRVSPGGQSVFLLDRNQTSTAAASPGLGRSAISTMRLIELSTTGDTLRDVRFAVPSRRVTASDIALIVDSMANPNIIISGVKPFGNPQEVRDSLAKPSMWPAVTEFFVGVDGSLWFRQPQPPSKSAAFWRLTAQGKEVYPVIVPSNVRVVRVSLDRIWGIAEDEDGTQSVQVLEVVTPNPAKRSLESNFRRLRYSHIGRNSSVDIGPSLTLAIRPGTGSQPLRRLRGSPTVQERVQAAYGAGQQRVGRR